MHMETQFAIRNGTTKKKSFWPQSNFNFQKQVFFISNNWTNFDDFQKWQKIETS